MALNEDSNTFLNFAEEINYNDIERLEVVGKGSFGVVWRGRWKDRDVAVKVIESEAEKKSFSVEVRQLSRVSHPNIVKLYGACTGKPVCLVMEYAEGGSLYNVLHCRPLPKYNAGHAMSWVLQCARGVAYLHGMKPKALIHRDLKPPNLLLVSGGKILKICDFGTACDKNTYMTNNKGSAAWMAPEVFETSNYTEKCDVFSWGIILWEVMTRRKPFDDLNGTAYTILWAVHKGQRPPPIEGCPPPLEELMTSCWDKEPEKRPAMEEVVRVMSHLFQYFTGSDEPITYPENQESSESIENEDEKTMDSQDTEYRMTFPENSQTQASSFPNSSSNSSIVPEEFYKPLLIDVGESAQALMEDKENVIENISGHPEAVNPFLVHPSPPSTSNPPNRVLQPLGDNCKFSSSSPLPSNPPLPVISRPTSLHPLTQPITLHPPRRGHESNLTNDQWELGEEISPVDETPPKFEDLSSELENSNDQFNNQQRNMQNSGGSSNSPQVTPVSDPVSQRDLENVYLMLDPQLHPIMPDTNNEESLRVFEEHKQLAQEYLKVQTEIAYMSRTMGRLANELSDAERRCQLDQEDSEQNNEELRKLESEKESLVQLHRNLKKQLEIIHRQGAGEHSWVMVSRPTH